MSSERQRVLTPVAFATIGLIVLLGLRPVAAERIVAGYVLALAAIALASLTRLLAQSTDARASAFERALPFVRAEPPRPSELVRVEREITLGTSSAGHLEHRLLPMLREVAEARLGLELERQPAAARERLGEEAWELLRPDRPEPVDRNAPGLPLRQLHSVVDTLERL
jgi:hypothetical protein